MSQQIENVLKHWDFSQIEVMEQFREDSPRLIYKIKAENHFYILKGIPKEKPESVIVGNVTAHQFLGNEKGIAPCVFAMENGDFYVKENGFWFYLLEFIDGQPMESTVENEYLLGRLARRYHAYTEYPYPAGISEDKQRFYEWFADRAFKPAFDRILDGFPDFNRLDRCLIHTDLGPHNVMMTPDNRPVLIDLDDAGLGCRLLDLGYALICQFVEHDDEMNLWYRFDYAKAFLEGYYENDRLTREEYDALWSGAAYMQISYMKCYGDDAVDSLWKILEFGLAQKEALWDALSGRCSKINGYPNQSVIELWHASGVKEDK